MAKNFEIKKQDRVHASQQLQVSEATVQNWLKAKLLKTLSKQELDQLKKKLANGKINKLNKRANKRSAHLHIHFHPELLSEQHQPEVKFKLDQFITANFNDKTRLLLAIYLNLLASDKLIQFDSKSFIINNAKIKSELEDWPIELADKKLILLAHQLKKINALTDASVLSYAYQSTSSTGEKNLKGAYYTPTSIIRAELAETLKKDQSYCDPCCGGGAFLIQAYLQHLALKSKQAHQLVYGFDLDKIAVLISRANLTLLSKGQIDVRKQVRCLNAITTDLDFKFDVIATNPPWGAQIAMSDSDILKNKFKMIKSHESFSYFLVQALNYLKPNARLSFILPESILNIKAHQDIRHFLLKNYRITSIKEISEKFSGVMTKVISLQVANQRPTANNEVLLLSKDNSYYQKQVSYLKNSLNEISLNINDSAFQILTLIEDNSKYRLKNNADWGLGIVTGNNKKYLKAKSSLKTQAVVKGVDICRFQLNKPSGHLLFEPSQFQQIAPIEKYKTPAKLVYRFICKEWVFAIDRQQHLTLNSANFLIPRLKSHSIESLCGLFNSKLAQYYFQKKFNTFKVLRYHIESFPIADFTPKQATEIDFLVGMLEKQFDEAQYQKLNQLVYQIYKIDKSGVAEIEKTFLSKAFIK